MPALWSENAALPVIGRRRTLRQDADHVLVGDVVADGRAVGHLVEDAVVGAVGRGVCFDGVVGVLEVEPDADAVVPGDLVVPHCRMGDAEPAVVGVDTDGLAALSGPRFVF